MSGSTANILVDLIAKVTLEHGKLQGSKTNKLKETLISLQGICHSISAIISSIPSSPFGIPNTVTTFAFQTAVNILKTETNNEQSIFFWKNITN